MKTTEIVYTTEEARKDAIHVFLRCLLTLLALGIGGCACLLIHKQSVSYELLIGLIVLLISILIYEVTTASKNFNGTLWLVLIGGVCYGLLMGYIMMSSFNPVTTSATNSNTTAIVDTVKTTNNVSIYEDPDTGVEYLITTSSQGVTMTPRLDAQGNLYVNKSR